LTDESAKTTPKALYELMVDRLRLTSGLAESGEYRIQEIASRSRRSAIDIEYQGVTGSRTFATFPREPWNIDVVILRESTPSFDTETVTMTTSVGIAAMLIALLLQSLNDASAAEPLKSGLQPGARPRTGGISRVLNRMLRISVGTCVILLGLSASALCAALLPHRAVVQVSADTISKPSPAIVLKWKPDPAVRSWAIYRRPMGVEGFDRWGSELKAHLDLGAKEVRYLDSDVEIGSTYEYRIDKMGTSDGRDYVASTFILVGLEEPPVEQRGKLILLVDDRFVEALRPELTRLTHDLIGDGWEVIRHDVASTLSVRQVKSIIKAEYAADPAGVKSVFLFGRLPVPYSGSISPDGHKVDHLGAWPADVYYGDMDDELWTDVDDKPRINDFVPRIEKHVNVPGDGKFDQSTIPGDGRVELAVGRADLSDMPAFGVPEAELMRRYLDKNHRYRHRVINPDRRALHIDGFGYCEDGIRNFTPILGFENIDPKVSLTWFPSLREGSYLWAYGAGGGQPTSCISIGTTTDFANNQVPSVFHILFGSFFGVWDDRNSLLRAPLASQPNGLTSLWGRRFWTLHEMGLGRPIGSSVRRSQSRNVAAFKWNDGIQTALMGDPTLRLFMVAPPRNVAVQSDRDRGVLVSWESSEDAVLGYHVYRQDGTSGRFTRLTGNKSGTSGFITGNSFTDTNPTNEPARYMVRAIRLETVNSGTFYNLSQGMPATFSSARSGFTVATTVESSIGTTSNVRRLPAGTYQTLTVPPESNSDATSVCTWAGIGSVPADGVGTSVRIFLDRDSTIRWKWSANRDSEVTISSPIKNQNFTQPADIVMLEATAADPDGLIRKVEFYVGTTLLGEDRDSVFDFKTDSSGVAYKARGQPSVATYRYEWKNVPDGSYGVTAKSYDDFGGSTTSAPIKFTVSGKNVPPTVSIESPKRGAIYKTGSAKFNLQATAKDDGTITKVEYFLGAKSLGSSFSPPYSLWQSLNAGTYTFTAKATDQQGATTISPPVTITVAAE
jgi:hypothetical protein